MIEERYIISAREIRKKYKEVAEELDNRKNNIDALSSFLEEKASEISKMKDEVEKNVKSMDDFIKYSEKLMITMTEIEEKEKSLNKRIDVLSKDMEKLKTDETNLLVRIREKYPDLSVEQIRNEVHSKL